MKDENDKNGMSSWTMIKLGLALFDETKIDRKALKREGKEAFRKELRNKWFHLEVIISVVPFIWLLSTAVTGADPVIPLVAVFICCGIAFAIDFIRKLIKQIREQ